MTLSSSDGKRTYREAFETTFDEKDDGAQVRPREEKATRKRQLKLQKDKRKPGPSCKGANKAAEEFKANEAKWE